MLDRIPENEVNPLKFDTSIDTNQLQKSKIEKWAIIRDPINRLLSGFIVKNLPIIENFDTKPSNSESLPSMVQ